MTKTLGAIRIPVIKVKDKDNGTEHIIGTDVHDRLVIENNALHYYNLHNGCGSKGGTYEFVGEAGNPMYAPDVTVEFLTFEEYGILYEKLKAEQEQTEKEVEEMITRLRESKAL